MTTTSPKTVPVGTVVSVPDPGLVQRPDGTVVGPAVDYALTEPGVYRLGDTTITATTQGD